MSRDTIVRGVFKSDHCLTDIELTEYILERAAAVADASDYDWDCFNVSLAIRPL